MITEIKQTKLENLNSSLIEKNVSKFGKLDGFLVLDGNWSCRQDTKISYVCLEPVLKVIHDGTNSYWKDATGTVCETEDVWKTLKKLCSLLNAKDKSIADCNLPFIGGYFSYELLHYIEEVPKTKSDSNKVPIFVFYLYSSILTVSSDKNNLPELTKVSYSQYEKPIWPAGSLTELNEKIGSIKSAPSSNRESIEEVLPKYSNFSKDKYLENIKYIKDNISLGNVYQVNLTQKFELPFRCSPSEFFLKLKNVSPSAYGAFINFSKEEQFNDFSIASSSPELFIESDGLHLFSSPIKGTIKRGSSRHEDEQFLNTLINSKKDHAELAMIVDLIRNDMGRVAKVGSVKVINHGRIETLPYVYHLVSDISCELSDSATIVDIIKALFPCGSITGAPKIAAMEFISDIEKTQRGVYTGAVGYYGMNRKFKFNVAIRTATIMNETLFFNAGGGIVIDSNPEDEYSETISKAVGLYETYCSL